MVEWRTKNNVVFKTNFKCTLLIMKSISKYYRGRVIIKLITNLILPQEQMQLKSEYQNNLNYRKYLTDVITLNNSLTETYYNSVYDPLKTGLVVF